MNFLKPKEPPATAAPTPFPPQLFLRQAVNSIQTHCSNFFQNLQSNPPFKTTFPASISTENNTLSSSSKSSATPKNHAISPEAIDERLAGVPVYALSNGSQEFVLLSGTNTGKNLGLFCFSEADAETLLEQMKSVDPTMSSGSKVVPVALSKIFQLKVDGVALRLMPEASQIQNALKERERAGIREESFPGVPVFQSKSLILRSQTKQYRPVFFRKEDLEKSLSRASRDQKQLNPSLRKGDVQVAVLEEIIQGMKDSSASSWDDVVFIPPGFDVSTDGSRQY
ncbi:hypothetical protein ABFS82_07G074600 [Erythranthe guttata]|uniref:Protein TIC 22-like, chloroplastic n=1 Tax=Erythranthe guttata TaxID=4155 RepID=A0A022RGS6_ERYGU|nr:PREDICTED: protein TIC 22-like, chloroplastic [Erythranthe guttata]EYU38968.1 hypothetical protein MIMGU_mgv1a011459mg [Erythranthe guttata]|eukprot:XP_012835551.1 PREDICTED: protein TIC 22-like, chloroplastic [Erythranthe guttata]